MPAERRKFEKDLRLARVLISTPLATVKEVAARVGMPVSTVQKRIRRLKETGLLCYQLVPSSWTKLFGTRAMISIDVDTELAGGRFGYNTQEEFVTFLKYRLQDQPEFREYTKDIIIENADILLGGFCDVVLSVASSDTIPLCDFVTRCVRKLPGVVKTNTATLIAARNEKVRRRVQA